MHLPLVSFDDKLHVWAVNETCVIASDEPKVAAATGPIGSLFRSHGPNALASTLASTSAASKPLGVIFERAPLGAELADPGAIGGRRGRIEQRRRLQHDTSNTQRVGQLWGPSVVGAQKPSVFGSYISAKRRYSRRLSNHYKTGLGGGADRAIIAKNSCFTLQIVTVGVCNRCLDGVGPVDMHRPYELR